MSDFDQLLADIAELTAAWSAVEHDPRDIAIRPNEAYIEAIYPIKEW